MNNIQKIYIVKASFSSWDSYYERSIRAFYKIEDAEKYVEKANRVLGAMSSHIDKATEMRNLDNIIFDGLSHDEILEKLDEIENSAEYIKALQIWDAHSNLEEFNKCKIIELEIK